MAPSTQLLVCVLCAAYVKGLLAVDSGYPYYDDEGALYNETYADLYYDSPASSSGTASRQALSDEEAAWSVKDTAASQGGHSGRRARTSRPGLEAAEAEAAPDAADSYFDEGSGYEEGEGSEGYEGDAEGYEAHGLEYDPQFVWDSCTEDASGHIVVNGTEQCDLLLSGVDVQSDRLVGGLDGNYKLVGCHQGKPAYARTDGPPDEERCLFFNSLYGDWEFAAGPTPTDDQLLMYSDAGFLSPLDVPSWHLAAALNTEEAQMMPSPDEDLYFIALDVTVLCASQTPSEIKDEL